MADSEDRKAFEEWFMRTVVRPYYACELLKNSDPKFQFQRNSVSGEYEAMRTQTAWLGFQEGTSRERDFVQGCLA